MKWFFASVLSLFIISQAIAAEWKQVSTSQQGALVYEVDLSSVKKQDSAVMAWAKVIYANKPYWEVQRFRFSCPDETASIGEHYRYTVNKDTGETDVVVLQGPGFVYAGAIPPGVALRDVQDFVCQKEI